MIVMKFGGSSVANRNQIAKVLEIVKGFSHRNPVVVSSAHKGMTDALVTAARMAAKREFQLPDVIDLQSEIALSLGCPKGMLDTFFHEISDLLRGIGLVRELSPRSLDYIASFGERMAVRCIADFFNRNGLKARAYDVWDLGFITDLNFGSARPLPGYEEKMRQAFAEKVPPGVVPVVTGFVGRAENGDITTVGRNGSDLTASLVASALKAEEVQIWTDTDGVMTADPSVVPSARNIPSMCFAEAAELSYFGSQVLHPSTLLPAMRSDIPVRVLNTNQPGHQGTVIDASGPEEPTGVTSVAYKENQVVFSISTAAMLQRAGFLAKLTRILGRHEVVVDVIATSEISLSLTTDNLETLQKAMPELKMLGTCEVHTGKTILVVVGPNKALRGRLAPRILDALEEGGVDLDMVSFAQGSINFSMVMDDHDIQTAVPILHRILFEEEAPAKA